MHGRQNDGSGCEDQSRDVPAVSQEVNPILQTEPGDQFLQGSFQRPLSGKQEVCRWSIQTGKGVQQVLMPFTAG